ncbi:Outer membrane protein OmpA [Gemmobacter megaterium]|uniref:Outer membrane protein OmpA n=1 Tax=Gemmobacter megaterium TaxID=1086013 RepID=A0A1N7QDB9_9RHOB|nr:OmpA family protein [Gemmobacter megaterium]GGE25159.1 membrane protein [Gemmobacter megaterium]SIT20855.1 Outer membrane protein OmpA [Gemmobacter megaterium]
MKFKTPVLIGSVAIIGLTACDPYPQGNPDNTRTRTGAATGAVIGGLIGATSNSSTRPLATVAGAAVGAAIGGAIGQGLDRQAADLRAQTSGNIGVVNAGDYLVVTMPQDLLFATDSSSLRPDLQSDLRAVAGNLLQYPNSRIEVIGHTDSTGDAGYNRSLSARRAQSVASVLIGSGVPSSRIATIGRGEDAPVATNLTPEGRAQNRRVEVIIRPTS